MLKIGRICCICLFGDVLKEYLLKTKSMRRRFDMICCWMMGWFSLDERETSDLRFTQQGKIPLACWILPQSITSIPFFPSKCVLAYLTVLYCTVQILGDLSDRRGNVSALCWSEQRVRCSIHVTTLLIVVRHQLYNLLEE